MFGPRFEVPRNTVEERLGKTSEFLEMADVFLKEQEVSLNLGKSRNSACLDVKAALGAICSTGKGRCWHCDVKLPPAEAAIDAGWHVQRVEGERVASIILVCPKCLRSGMDVDEEEFQRDISPRPSNATY